MKISTRIELLLKEAIKGEVQEIRFFPGIPEADTQVHFATHEDVCFKENVSANTYQQIIRYLSLKAQIQYKSLYVEKGMVSLTLDDQEVQLRVTTVPVSGDMPGMIIRVIETSKYATFEDIAKNPKEMQDITNTIMQRPGLFVFTGKSGSGKTVVINAVINELAKDLTKEEIIGVEELVEIKNENMMQMQINNDVGITYQLGLKAAMRHNPRVIFISELNDRGVAKFVLTAIREGVSVITTMNVKDFEEMKGLLNYWDLQADLSEYLNGASRQKIAHTNEGLKVIFNIM